MRKWINIEDKLPEIDEDVVWYHTDGNCRIWAIDKDMDWDNQVMGVGATSPTHWMSLPEPPKDAMMDLYVEDWAVQS